MRRFFLSVSLIFLMALPSMGEAPSGKKAFWRSLLVPGWGQRYAGRSTSAVRFLTFELALWGGYFGFQRLGEVREDNFRSYAAEHARARMEGKDDQFLDDLGFYENWLQHDQFARYEEGPSAILYPEGAEFFWEWDGDASRRRYRELRNSSESAGRQALYMTGLVVANHLISAVHAGRSAGRIESEEQGKTAERRRTGVEAGLDRRGGMRVALVRRF